MLGSLILKGMNILMFQLSGFYYRVFGFRAFLGGISGSGFGVWDSGFRGLGSGYWVRVDAFSADAKSAALQLTPLV